MNDKIFVATVDTRPNNFPCTQTAEKEPKEAVFSAIFLLTYNNEDTIYQNQKEKCIKYYYSLTKNFVC